MSDWKMHGKPALLILHMQLSLKERESKILEETGIIPRQQALLKAFRSKKMPVIYVNDKPFPLNGDLHFPVYGCFWENYGKSEVRENPEDWEVIPELAPQLGEPVLFNWPFGAFNNSGLERALKLYHVDTLVVVGFASYGVVASAIQEARNRLYSAIVPKDASAGPSAKAHKVFMEIIAPAISLVTTTDDFIAHL
jgi:nicotinamidase-related amidase